MRIRILILVLACFVLAGLPLTAAPAAGRKILVLYKQRDPTHDGLVARYTGYLRDAGYTFDSKDVESYFPSSPDTSEYSGILTCYESNNMIGADRYALWLDKQMEAGKKVAIIGMYGAFQGLAQRSDKSLVEWNESALVVNTFLWPFGLEFFPAFANKPGIFTITKKEKQFAEFQAPIAEREVERIGYQLFRSANPANRVYLAVKRSDLRDSESAFVVHTPFGGMILQGYTPYWDPERVDKVSGKKGTVVQRTDMVAFLQGCFDGPAPPVPHYNLQTHDALQVKNPLPERARPPDPWQAHAGEAKRRVLVLYKRDELALTKRNTSGPILEHHPFYNRADIVLAGLGIAVDYRAVEDGLPADSQMERYRGIVTWFTTPFMAHARRYNDWVLHQVQRGQKLVVLQDYGATIDSITNAPATNAGRVLDALGIEFGKLALARFEKFPRVRVLDKSMIGFEHPLNPNKLTYAHRYASKLAANKIYLSLEDPYSGPVDLVVTTPHGGIAMEESAFFFPPGDVDRIHLIREALAGRLMPEKAEEPTLGAWIVDPYKFFTEALALQDVPAADYSTMNGARLFYAHIDGDGLDSLSREDGTYFAGRYILDEVLQKYPQVPQSVSVITRFVERAGNDYYNPSVELAREIFRLPQIEPASHASTHPFDWVGGDPYVTNPREYPWKVAYKPQNVVDEIWGSKLFIDANLAPPTRPLNMMFWSGATNPDEKALEVCWRARVHNLNGGDPIYDSEHPSVAGLCPVTTPYGPYRQYQTSARNDYIYMLFLLGDWDGQKKVLDHYAHTESPHRIMPMNLYYHFYSGLKWESLHALQYVIDHVVKMEPAMVFASEYCRIAEDFYGTNIWKDGAAWRVSNAGDLREVRFHHKTHVDVAASEGVAGYSHFQGETYVHLDGRAVRRIVLIDAPPASPALERCTFFVDRATATGSKLELEVRGLGHFAARFRGVGGGTWHLTMTDAAGKTVIDQAFTADSDGMATVKAELPAPQSKYRMVLSRG